MHFTSRNANFCTHSKFTPIGELGRGIVHQDRAVNPSEEFVAHGHIFAHHAFCVCRAIGLDMFNRLVHICNGLGGNMLSKYSCPISSVAGMMPSNFEIAASPRTSTPHGSGPAIYRAQGCPKHPVDRAHSAAPQIPVRRWHSGPHPWFSVDRRFVDIDMHNPLKMGENGMRASR